MFQRVNIDFTAEITNVGSLGCLLGHAVRVQNVSGLPLFASHHAFKRCSFETYQFSNCTECCPVARHPIELCLVICLTWLSRPHIIHRPVLFHRETNLAPRQLRKLLQFTSMLSKRTSGSAAALPPHCVSGHQVTNPARGFSSQASPTAA